MTDFISFALRVFLVIALWGFIWHFIEVKTQGMRIFRAAVLVLVLLVVLALVRVTG